MRPRPAAALTQQPGRQARPGIRPRSSAQTGREYTGNPVSLDFQQADLRAVLRVFAEISGLNIVIDPTVQGTVDVALRDVPWDQALDIILRANKLGYIVDGTIVRIAPLTVLADEEGQRRKLADEQALAGELQVLTKTLSYAKAEELQTLLTRSALSQRGTVQVDPRTNTLIITDLPDRLQTATQLIETLDKAQPQVEIEARIVQTNKNFARELGVQWGFNGRVDPALGNTTNLAFPNSGSAGRPRRSGRRVPGTVTTPTAVNLPVGAATSAVGLALGSVNGAFNLDVALTALEQSGNGRILSTPRVSTLNNVEAEITQGVQIPLQTIANNTVTVTFKDAALLAEGHAADHRGRHRHHEDLARERDAGLQPRRGPGRDSADQHAARHHDAARQRRADDRHRRHLHEQPAEPDEQTPGLGQIPLLKWLFKRDRVSDESRSC